MRRREFVAASAATLLLPRAAGARTQQRLAAGGAFAQGVMSGLPGRRSITLWTRLDDVERPGHLSLEVSTDPDFRSTLLRKRVPLAENVARARIEDRRLKPGERYWYRFEADSGLSPVGRFQTARPYDSAEPVKVAFFCCQLFPGGFFTPHRGLAQEDVDLAVSLGDYYYETDFNGLRNDRSSNGEGSSETLEEYRAKYATYRSDPYLREMQQAHPLLALWDDHEVVDNYEGDSGDASRVPFAERRANAYRAFFEHFPVVRVRSAPDRLHRRLPLGRHADLFLLDSRRHRDRAARTLLGAQQKRWLLRSLAASPAAFKLVASPILMMATDTPPGTTTNPDQWDGYPEERAEILGALIERGVRGVSFHSGDTHAFYAGTATTTGRTGGDPAATEFCCGTISSINGGTANAALAGPITAPLTSGASTTNNPHITFADNTQHGYSVVTATPDELRVDFRVTRSIATDANIQTRTLASFRVGRDDVTVQRVG